MFGQFVIAVVIKIIIILVIYIIGYCCNIIMDNYMDIDTKLTTQLKKYAKTFDTFDEFTKKCIVKMATESIKNNKYLELEKLLKNAIVYVQSNQIKKIKNGLYIVIGNHNKYIIRKHNNQYHCVCPMYKKEGKYANVKNQKCSHIQAIELFKCIEHNKLTMQTTQNIQTTHMPKNIYLLSGDPGAGKSYCINKIISEFGDKTIGTIITDTRQNGSRITFDLVVMNGTSILARKTFAKKERNHDFNIKVGSWYVYSSIIDQYAVPTINEIIIRIKLIKADEKFLFVIDELGKMQSTSESYVQAIDRLIETIEANLHKNFVVVFVVPTNNSKWKGLDLLKKKYKQFMINFNTRQHDQNIFIETILGHIKNY